MRTRRASPEDISDTRRSARWVISSRSSARSTFSSIFEVARRFGHSSALPKKPVRIASRAEMSRSQTFVQSGETIPNCGRSEKMFQRLWPRTVSRKSSDVSRGWHSRVMVLIRDDLPEPLGPRMATCCPRGMESEIESRALFPLRRTVTLRKSNSERGSSGEMESAVMRSFD